MPVLCIGETLEERESGKLEEVLRQQITGALEGIPAGELSSLVVAYEPVWAIGTGVVPAPSKPKKPTPLCVQFWSKCLVLMPLEPPASSTVVR